MIRLTSFIIGQICSLYLFHEGGPGSTGTVSHIADWEPNTYRSKVRVQWSNGKGNNYRMGYNGKVDVRYIEEGYGGYYYRDHLPELGKTIQGLRGSYVSHFHTANGIFHCDGMKYDL